MKVSEHEAFQYLDDFLAFIDQNKPESFKPSGQELIIMGLLNKVISNTRAIRNLIQGHFLEESIILIRSIYEACLYLNYFFYHKDLIEKYVAVSYAYSLRNWLFLREAIVVVDPHVVYPVNNSDSDKAINSIQESLKKSKYLRKDTLTDEILNDPKKIYNKLIKCNDLPSVDNIKNFLMKQEPDVFKSLDVLHTRLYFQASESAHSCFSSIQDFHLLEGRHPQFNFNQIMSSIAYLLFLAIYAPTQLKIVPFSYEEAKEKISAIFTASTSYVAHASN